MANVALLASMTNTELTNHVEYMDEIPQAEAQELAHRLKQLVDSGQIPEDSESYRDDLEEKDDEISRLKEIINSAICSLEDA